MAQQFTDNKMRTAVDVRPGYNQGNRDKGNGVVDNAGAIGYPGKSDESSLRRSSIPQEQSIRNVRVGDLGPGFGNGPLGAMELAGETRSIPKVPPMQKFASKPITGPGPIEQERLTQQQANAIAMCDPDYAPQRGLDYESIKDANFTVNSQKSASKSDKDFTK